MNKNIEIGKIYRFCNRHGKGHVKIIKLADAMFWIGSNRGYDCKVILSEKNPKLHYISKANYIYPIGYIELLWEDELFEEL